MRMLRRGLCGLWILALASLVGAPAREASAQAVPAPANIRLALQPLTNYTTVLLARDKGFFAEEKLNVTWTLISQGAWTVEAVYGGNVEFGGSGLIEPLIARGNGLELMLAVANTRIRPTAPDNNAVLVRTEDAIHKPADLAGKTIAAGLINSINYIHMVHWLKNKGVDPTSVRFLELPFPQMADALYQKRLDAVWNVEPFMTLMVKSGNARILVHPYLENNPNMDVTGFYARESWLKNNSDVALRFKRAMDKATRHFNDASKAERDEWVAKFTGVKIDLVAQMALPHFVTEFNLPALRKNVDLAVSQKVIKPFDVESMIWKP
jgi:ABC-type nitrate/sulfonate/bicarbonate transport system substrate-binding protein